MVSRSGTLTYEAVGQLTALGMGQSTSDRNRRRSDRRHDTRRCAATFQADNETDGIVMIGEIGGTAEEEAAAFAKANVTKPSSHSSPDRQRRRDVAWAMQARSSPAAKEPRQKK